jgi:16S rRNA processing protein RimM
MSSNDGAQQWIVLAQILRPQGRKGEVLAELLTDFPERFAEHPQVWLAPAGFADSGVPAADFSAKLEAAEVAAHWLPLGRNAGRVVLHFAGVDSIEKAEHLYGKEVVVPLADRLPLEPGAAYTSDLAGCTIYDHGRAIGIVSEVHFATTPDGGRRLEEAAPLLAVIGAEGNEILIPFVTAFLEDLDLPAKSIRMKLPEGLVEVNQGEINQTGRAGKD